MPHFTQSPICATGTHTSDFHHPTLVLLVLNFQQMEAWCLGDRQAPTLPPRRPSAGGPSCTSLAQAPFCGTKYKGPLPLGLHPLSPQIRPHDPLHCRVKRHSTQFLATSEACTPESSGFHPSRSPGTVSEPSRYSTMTFCPAINPNAFLLRTRAHFFIFSPQLSC